MLRESLVSHRRETVRSKAMSAPAPLGLTLRGTGPAVVPLTGAAAWLVTFSSNGAHGALVDVLDQAGEVAELLINVEGGYTGTRVVGPAGYVPGGLRITTHGNWSITLRAASEAPLLELGVPVRGRGDRVLRLPEHHEHVRLRASTGHVMVVARDEAGLRYELLVNEVGGYGGLVRVPYGCSLLEVSTPGTCVVEAVQPAR